MNILIITTQGDFTKTLSEGLTFTDFVQDIAHNGYWLDSNHHNWLAPSQVIRVQLLSSTAPTA